MNIYLAYKYNNVTDKKTLITDLDFISKVLTKLGHNVFILGRDVQKWDHNNYSITSTIKDIVKYLRRQDLVLLYINEASASKGMTFEVLLAKLLHKKIVLAVKNDVKCHFFSRFAQKMINYSSLSELSSKLPHLLT